MTMRRVNLLLLLILLGSGWRVVGTIQRATSKLVLMRRGISCGENLLSTQRVVVAGREPGSIVPCQVGLDDTIDLTVEQDETSPKTAVWC